ncbi:DNA binding protein with HTH domain [Rhizobium laguerreae]|uniref:DNA binding protein with HTH domain n=2 Tax=Rhizobium/Agrobacterium group TaxID=227290 RepID=A0AAX2QL83_9HYPH|nr:RHE_PE00001 family protein [Rhizobium leguminosarum]TCU24313.1 DNA binding protein with HTH domain [Rhizobium laguerreae]
MSYDLQKLPISSLLRPVSDAGSALTRLDERIARSPVGEGFVERSHFTDACASLWVDGELVHLEDLVLHDATKDIRTPTHELTIARDVLKTRRRIAAQPPGWALSPEGLRSLRGQAVTVALDGAAEHSGDEPASSGQTGEGEGENDDADDTRLDDEFAAIDAVLARSNAAIEKARQPSPATSARARERDPLVYDLDWDEDERLEEWRGVLRQTQDLPTVLQAVVALDAWNDLSVLQHATWLGRLLSASLLRQAGITTSAHLAAINLGLKTIQVDRRRHRDRETRLLAIVDSIIGAAEFGLKEHDRLLLARTMMERKLVGRRASSKLPELIELVISRPLVSAGMIAKELAVTPRAALRIVDELALREMTGRGRFRAWGVL